MGQMGHLGRPLGILVQTHRSKTAITLKRPQPAARNLPHFGWEQHKYLYLYNLNGRPFGPSVFLTSLLGAASANPTSTAGSSRCVHIQRHSSQQGLRIRSEPAEGDAQPSRGRVKTKTRGVESKIAKTHGWDAIEVKTYSELRLNP